MRRRLMLALVLLAAVVLGASPAAASTHAAVEDPEILVFEGSRTGVALGSDDTPGRTYGPDDSRTEWECLDGTCRLLSINDREPVDEHVAWTFTDGLGSWSTPGSGNGCDNTEKRATNGTATFDGTILTVFVRYEPTPVYDCGGGNTTQTFANENTYVYELVEGEACVADASCVDVTPEPGGARPVTPSAPRDFAEPTVFGELDTVAAAAHPGNLLWAAVGAVILALLIAVPTHLFNSATETLSDRVGAWWRRRRGRPEAAPRKGVHLSGWPLAAVGVAAAAVIAAFSDPAFGFDAAGLRVLLSLLLSFGVEVVLGWFAVILIVRRTHPEASATFRFAPLTLLLVAGAVALTRATGFEPPLVFGLVAGVAFGGLLGTAEKARVALIGLGWAFGFGVLSWIAYSILAATGADGDGAVIASELLSASAIAGISALPLALIPVRGLAGRTLWEWNWIVWGAAYAVGLFAFLLVLLPLPASWAEVGVGLWTWVGLYVLYATAAVAVWLVVTRPWRHESAPTA